MKKTVYKVAVKSSLADFEGFVWLREMFEHKNGFTLGNDLEFNSMCDAKNYLGQFFGQLTDGVFWYKDEMITQYYLIVLAEGGENNA